MSPTTGANTITTPRNATNKPRAPHLLRLPRLTSRQWWGLTLAYASLVTVLAVIPTDPRLSAGQLDKPLHLCEYLLFAWCVIQAARSSQWSRRTGVTAALIVPVLYGAFLEGIQSLLPYRSAEFLDVVVNTVGALLGCWAGLRWPAVLKGES